MIRLTISNQRGGVAKTTTAVVLAWILAGLGSRVLVIDADPQGSIAAILGLRPNAFLYDLLISKLALRECLTKAAENIDIVCGNRYTTEAETALIGVPFRELTFEHLFREYERQYDAVIIDVAPSISLFQTCAMVYTKQVLIPVDMDVLSVQGAMASIQAAETLNRMLNGGLDIRPVGLLPVCVDRRLAITDTVLNTLGDISEKRGVRLLPQIRTDQAVVKAARHSQFLGEFDSGSKALADYRCVVDVLLSNTVSQGPSDAGCA